MTFITAAIIGGVATIGATAIGAVSAGKQAKRAGKDGDFILSPEGSFIYVKSTVVTGESKHVFIANTIRESQSAGAAGDAIADAVS